MKIPAMLLKQSPGDGPAQPLAQHWDARTESKSYYGHHLKVARAEIAKFLDLPKPTRIDVLNTLGREAAEMLLSDDPVVIARGRTQVETLAAWTELHRGQP